MLKNKAIAEFFKLNFEVLWDRSQYLYTVGLETNQYLKRKSKWNLALIYRLINFNTALTLLCKI